MRPERICILTVTYGDRVAFLRRMVESGAIQGIRQVLVFGNGLSEASCQKIEELAQDMNRRFGLTLTLVPAARNLGPAAAYAALVEQAAGRHDQMDGVLLLDDDNTLGADCIDRLIAARAAGFDGALSCIRSDRQYLVATAKTGRALGQFAGEAFGIDIRKKPLRLWRKLHSLLVPAKPDPALAVALPRGPYGGLFVPRPHLENVAPPVAEFVIYADDLDYTERLSQQAGLHLVRGAVVDDQEQSWNATPGTGKSKSSAMRLATEPADFRIYYALRNALFLDARRSTGPSKILFFINISALLTVTTLYAAWFGNWANLRLVLKSARDGITGHLGRDETYPLP